MSQKISLDAENFERIISLHLNYKWLNFQKKGLIELWSLAESEDDKELIEFLIKKFEYINTDRINEACLRFVEQIENRWNFSSQNTIVTAICDNANPDGSQHLVQCMKNKFSYNKGWKENNFSNSIAVTARELITPDINIVLVDDFVGTGYTLFRKYNWLLNQIKKIGGWHGTIKTISLASMEFAKENIAQLNSDHFSYLWLKKGISEHAPFDDRERFAVSMTLLEAKLKGKINKTKLPCFGFKSSESLYIYENYNIPNNVFPIFWWPELLDGTIRSTIFKRIF